MSMKTQHVVSQPLQYSFSLLYSNVYLIFIFIVHVLNLFIYIFYFILFYLNSQLWNFKFLRVFKIISHHFADVLVLQPIFLLSVDTYEPTFLADLQQSAVVGDMVVLVQNKQSTILSELSCYKRGTTGKDTDGTYEFLFFRIIFSLFIIFVINFQCERRIIFF